MSKDLQEASVLTDDEIRTLILSVCQGMGDVGGATESDMEKVVEWARRVRFDEAFLKLVLGGELVTKVDDKGRVMFKAAPKKSGR